MPGGTLLLSRRRSGWASVTGRSHDEVEETLTSEAAKAMALNLSAEMTPGTAENSWAATQLQL